MSSISQHSRTTCPRDCRFSIFRRSWSFRREWGLTLWSLWGTSCVRPRCLRSWRGPTRDWWWMTTRAIYPSTSVRLRPTINATTCCFVMRSPLPFDQKWWIGWSKCCHLTRWQRKHSSRVCISWMLTWNAVVWVCRSRNCIWLDWLPCSLPPNTKKSILWN